VPLTPQELADVRQRYARLSTPGLQEAYKEALERCKLDQELVQAWKVLRKAR
jgi:hypothetical protein